MNSIDKLLDKRRHRRLKIHNIDVDNFYIINNSQIAVFEDFLGQSDYCSPLNQHAGYTEGIIERGCSLLVDLEDKEEIAICLNKNLGLKVVKCQENPKNEIVCCLTSYYDNLDFLYFDGKEFQPLFRISLVKPRQWHGCYISNKYIFPEDSLSYECGLSSRKMNLYYMPKKAKDSSNARPLYNGYPFKESLKTRPNGDIDK